MHAHHACVLPVCGFYTIHLLPPCIFCLSFTAHLLVKDIHTRHVLFWFCAFFWLLRFSCAYVLFCLFLPFLPPTPFWLPPRYIPPLYHSSGTHSASVQDSSALHTMPVSLSCLVTCYLYLYRFTTGGSCHIPLPTTLGCSCTTFTLFDFHLPASFLLVLPPPALHTPATTPAFPTSPVLIFSPPPFIPHHLPPAMPCHLFARFYLPPPAFLDFTLSAMPSCIHCLPTTHTCLPAFLLLLVHYHCGTWDATWILHSVGHLPGHHHTAGFVLPWFCLPVLGFYTPTTWLPPPTTLPLLHTIFLPTVTLPAHTYLLPWFHLHAPHQVLHHGVHCWLTPLPWLVTTYTPHCYHHRGAFPLPPPPPACTGSLPPPLLHTGSCTCHHHLPIPYHTFLGSARLLRLGPCPRTAVRSTTVHCTFPRYLPCIPFCPTYCHAHHACWLPCCVSTLSPATPWTCHHACWNTHHHHLLFRHLPPVETLFSCLPHTPPYPYYLFLLQVLYYYIVSTTTGLLLLNVPSSTTFLVSTTYVSSTFYVYTHTYHTSLHTFSV